MSGRYKNGPPKKRTPAALDGDAGALRDVTEPVGYSSADFLASARRERLARLLHRVGVSFHVSCDDDSVVIEGREFGYREATIYVRQIGGRV